MPACAEFSAKMPKKEKIRQKNTHLFVRNLKFDICFLFALLIVPLQGEPQEGAEFSKICGKRNRQKSILASCFGKNSLLPIAFSVSAKVKRLKLKYRQSTLAKNSYILSQIPRKSGHFRYIPSLPPIKAKVNPARNPVWITSKFR